MDERERSEMETRARLVAAYDAMSPSAEVTDRVLARLRDDARVPEKKRKSVEPDSRSALRFGLFLLPLAACVVAAAILLRPSAMMPTATKVSQEEVVVEETVDAASSDAAVAGDASVEVAEEAEGLAPQATKSEAAEADAAAGAESREPLCELYPIVVTPEGRELRVGDVYAGKFDDVRPEESVAFSEDGKRSVACELIERDGALFVRYGDSADWRFAS
ncbi:MAG: hypothetical protein IKG18_04420 [Atopobiaceae bacterium]|nr:hypothetical protein [Atopobiaceae bacterium]MBR3313366.1 hypothetical protein [Atopobiaceae bacterium]